MHGELLSMRGITKAFNGVPVLKNVNFTLHKGEVVALMGENGAGKSTLMKILSGVYRGDKGEIIYESEPVNIREVKDAMQLGIVLIHQELNLLDNLDIASNIFLGREPANRLGIIKKNELYKQTRQVLDMLGLNIAVDTPVSALSIGEQQMIEIAKAVSQKASVLIMDEPTSSLTTAETNKLFSVIRDLTAKGVAIVYISHRLSEVYEIADRAVVLKDGQNSGELSRDEINHDNIVRLMVGRSLDQVTNRAIIEEKLQYDFEVSDLVTARYPDKKINFKIGRKEIVGIAGLIGSGRTEVVNTIFGAYRKTGGQIKLNGKEINIRQPADAISNGIFLVPEDRRKEGVITEMDIVDNITLPHLDSYSHFKLVSQKKARAAYKKQSMQLGIRSAMPNPLVKFLSGGNQQKVAIAKWLSQSASLMIFDEPTRGVDVGAKAEIYNIMRQIADNNTMVLMVSSDIEEVMKISDRILVMSEGEITGELLPPDFSEQNIIRLAMQLTSND